MQPKQSNDAYDVWKDPKYDDLDYETIIKQEYHDLGYNPRENTPEGHEKPTNQSY